MGIGGPNSQGRNGRIQALRAGLFRLRRSAAADTRGRPALPALRAAFAAMSGVSLDRSPPAPHTEIMGRNYIAERTIADPRARATAQRVVRERLRKRAAADRASLAQYLARAGQCAATRCDTAASTEGNPWWPCCCESCATAWTAAQQRRDERKAAQRQGIPVAEFRRRQAIEG